MSGSHFARWPQLERHRGRHLSDPSPEHGEPRDADEKPAPLGSPSATWCTTFVTSRPLLRAFLEVHRPPLTWDVPLLQTQNPFHFILGAGGGALQFSPKPALGSGTVPLASNGHHHGCGDHKILALMPSQTAAFLTARS